MKLTVTNSPIGLIILIGCIHQDMSSRMSAACAAILRTGWPTHGRACGLRPKADDCAVPQSARNKTGFSNMRSADLVVIAGWLHPFPFRTRP